MMYNPYFYGNPIEKIDNQMRELENLKKTYQQNQNQQPMNVFNVGNTPQIDFEAKMIDKNVKPDEIPIQRKTAFICLENALLSIKDVNGNIDEYKIEIPKTPEQLKIEELEKQNQELLKKLEEKEIKKGSK